MRIGRQNLRMLVLAAYRSGAFTPYEAVRRLFNLGYRGRDLNVERG